MIKTIGNIINNVHRNSFLGASSDFISLDVRSSNDISFLISIPFIDEIVVRCVMRLL